jgi:hypothetical protein
VNRAAASCGDRRQDALGVALRRSDAPREVGAAERRAMRYTGAVGGKAQTPETESEVQEWYYDSAGGGVPAVRHGDIHGDINPHSNGLQRTGTDRYQLQEPRAANALWALDFYTITASIHGVLHLPRPTSQPSNRGSNPRSATSFTSVGAHPRARHPSRAMMHEV